jgi:hypothetical protein
MSGMSPHLISITDSWASAAAIRMSAPSAICRPPPNTAPWSAAITGTGTSVHTHAACCAKFAGLSALRRSSSVSPGSLLSPAMAMKLAKSSPAQNARPSPDRTTARTVRSLDSVCPAATSPSNMARSRAFSFSGRLRRTSATPVLHGDLHALGHVFSST